MADGREAEAALCGPGQKRTIMVMMITENDPNMPMTRRVAVLKFKYDHRCDQAVKTTRCGK